MKILFFITVNEDFSFLRSNFNLIAQELIKQEHTIHAYDTKKCCFYDLNYKVKQDFKFGKFFLRLPFIRYLIQFISLLRFFRTISEKDYDVFQFCSIREEYLLIPKKQLYKSKFNIARLYGSDINKRSFIKNMFKGFYKQIHLIHISYNKMVKIIEKHYSSINYTEKIFILPPPNLNLNRILNKYTDRSKAKLELGIKHDEIVIFCGTNASVNEQHYKILNAILKIQNLNIYKLKFVFHLSNRIDKKDQYTNTLCNELSNLINDENLLIIERYLPIENLILYRYATDIFINIRKYDQLSGSMLEHFATGSRIVTGSWLGYQEFISDNGFLVDFIEKEDELSEKIIEVLESNSFLIQPNINAANKIFDFDRLLDDNINLYNTINARL